jgi:hypothetical protein
MAAVTYYMLCETSNGLVHDVRSSSFDVTALIGFEIRSASFSANAGDSPDVVASKPERGGTFTEDPISYSPPPSMFYLDLAWEGDGAVVDGMREMTANGTNSETLRLSKREVGTDSLQSAAEDNDEYRVCIRTSVGKPSAGRVQLVNGEQTISFTPASGDKGICEVEIIPIGSAPIPVGKVAVSFI